MEHSVDFRWDTLECIYPIMMTATKNGKLHSFGFFAFAAAQPFEEMSCIVRRLTFVTGSNDNDGRTLWKLLCCGVESVNMSVEPVSFRIGRQTSSECFACSSVASVEDVHW